MPRPTSVKCPNCSAPIRTDSNTCEYCGARLEFSQNRTKVVLAGFPCPECGVENDPTQRFCGSCGAPLVKTCPRCGEANPLGFRFCGACGLELPTPLVPTGEEMRQAAIDSHLHDGKSHDEEFKRLYGHLASPDEIVILGSRYRDNPKSWKTYTYSTDFMATDRCIYFLQPTSAIPEGDRQQFVTRRIPYDKLRSLSVDNSRGLLIIEFDNESAAVSPVHIAGHIHEVDSPARLIVRFLKPLLPGRIQRKW